MGFERDIVLAAQRRSALAVEVLDRAEALARLPAELDGLADRALESNLFAEAPVFLAGLEHMDRDLPLLVACVRDEGGLLHGVFPLVHDSLRSGSGPKVLRNWAHHNCSLGTPLVDATRAAEALTALLDWVGTPAAPAGAIRWTKLAWDGAFGAILRDLIDRQGWPTDTTVAERAVLLRDPGQKAAISGRHAKELRRVERRLADEGALDYAALQPGEAWEPWFDDFLAVEATGWKGAEGSAIGSRPQDTAFFRSVVRQAHAAGRLQMLRLTVGGKVVAMKLNVRGGDTAYALKIGYDEAYARFSPGVLLELFNIKAFDHERDYVQRMDSCAVANHPMINRLWSGRRQIATVTVVRRGLFMRALVWAAPRTRSVRAAWAEWRSGRVKS